MNFLNLTPQVNTASTTPVNYKTASWAAISSSNNKSSCTLRAVAAANPTAAIESSNQ
jgi:hypothetical protein